MQLIPAVEAAPTDVSPISSWGKDRFGYSAFEFEGGWRRRSSMGRSTRRGPRAS
jgi:hypothetical protein